MKQQIITAENNYKELDKWFQANNCRNTLLVCDGSIKYMETFNEYLDSLKSKVNIVPFSDFQPNPLYESAVEGVNVLKEKNCDSIIAVGGGSAMDVAKCIKAYCTMPGDGSNGEYLNQEIKQNGIPFLAFPTTAGTGSEATRYAVLYYNGAKQSITSESFIPVTVLMDPNALKTLPLYQKKATMMDAFCHALESFWSINSTDESKKYSREAIKGVISSLEGYLANTDEGNAGMLKAAHMAGKAINITQTTAGHAMCYKITSLFGVAHGHAAILCDRVLFPWMIENTDRCVDSRGIEYLENTFAEIAEAMDCKTAKEASDKMNALFEYLEFEIPCATEKQIDELVASVNSVRLKNHPIKMDDNVIHELYCKTFKGR